MLVNFEGFQTWEQLPHISAIVDGNGRERCHGQRTWETITTLPSDAALVMPCPDRHARLQIAILIIISLPVSPRAFTPPSSPRVVDGARPVVGEERGGDTCPWLFVVAAASARILADEERRCPLPG